MIEVTLGYLLHNSDWDRACEILGLNPWCINEGANRECTVNVTFEQAEKIGLVVRLTESKEP